jgi:hypothetical protein
VKQNKQKKRELLWLRRGHGSRGCRVVLIASPRSPWSCSSCRRCHACHRIVVVRCCHHHGIGIIPVGSEKGRRCQVHASTWSELAQACALCRPRWCSWPWSQWRGHPWAPSSPSSLWQDTRLPKSQVSTREGSEVRKLTDPGTGRTARERRSRQEVRVLVGLGVTRHTSRVSVIM